MRHSGYVTLASETCAGVSVRLKRMTDARRRALVELQADVQRTRVRPLQEKLTPLAREYREAVDAAKAAVKTERDALVATGLSRQEAEVQVPLPKLGFDDAKWRELLRLSAEIGAIDAAELTPIAVEFAVVSISGLDIETALEVWEPATVALLIEHGPEELYAEIAAWLKRELGLDEGERENLRSPSTSAAAVDGASRAGSADRVATPDTTISGDARDTTGPGSASAGSTP